MNAPKTISWGAVWMIALPLAGMPVLHRYGLDARAGFAFAVLLTLLAVGIFVLKTREALPEEPYCRAFARMRSRWLLSFFGAVAAVNTTGALARYLLGRLLYHKASASLSSGRMITDSNSASGYLLPHNISSALFHAMQDLFPSIGLNTGRTAAVVSALAGLTLSIYLLRKLSGPRLLRGLLITLGALSVAMLAVVPLAERWAYTSFRLHSYAFPASITSLVALEALWAVILSLTLTPLLLGALFGSLSREHVNLDAMCQDTANYFRPLFGLFLIGWLLSVLLHTPSLLLIPKTFTTGAASSPAASLQMTIVPMLTALAAVAFMFVPVAIVRRGLGLREGIRAGLCVWTRWREALPFAALGVTLFATTRAVYDTAFTVFRAPLIVSLTLPALLAFIAAFAMVAVWEFFSAWESPERIDSRL
ncbi:MAG: hypothetical protein ACYC2Y_09010 [Armatimonadota bacterium]